MNRRELISSIGAAVAGAGVAAKVSAVDAEPKLLALVLSTDRCLSKEKRDKVAEELERVRKKVPGCPPFIIADGGAKISPIYTEPPLAEINSDSTETQLRIAETVERTCQIQMQMIENIHRQVTTLLRKDSTHGC